MGADEIESNVLNLETKKTTQLGAPPKPKLEAIDVYLKEGILSEKQATAPRQKHQQYQIDGSRSITPQRSAGRTQKILAEQRQVSQECRKLYRPELVSR